MSAADGACLQTRALCAGYGKRVVVSDVELAVHAGQVVTLIGPNGAGKSTLLQTVSGLIPALSGHVELMGRELGRCSARELALQRAVVLTQRPGTELMSVADVVEAGRYPHTGRFGVLSRADRAAMREAMELTDVWSMRDEDFMCLSDGQRQRVMLARAICQQPRLIVLDEPTGFLDIRYQLDVLNVLRTLARSKDIAVLMSLHELPLARIVSDWLVCVKDGHVMLQGNAADVFRDEVIDALYDLAPGAYDARSGQVHLADIDGGGLPAR